jgi:hypothetical protein
MKLNFHPKMIGVVVISAISLILIIKVNDSITKKVEEQIAEIQNRYVPMIELGPQFEAQFENIRRDLQDAVSARDNDLLQSTLETKKLFLTQIQATNKILEPSQIKELTDALESYFTSAYDVSSRLMAGETGVTLVRVMVHMQLKQAHLTEVLKKTTTFDRNKLSVTLGEIKTALEKAVHLQLLINVVCVLSILLFSIWMIQTTKFKTFDDDMD